MSTFLAWWLGLDHDEQARWHGVFLCVALCLFHFALLSTWYIEDAAITFSFARHAASGEGFVAYPGGERVQGFSNPSWTLLLALADLVGINPWIAAKLFGAAFTALTLPLAYRWARRVDHGVPLLAVLAPLMLAVSPQHVIWGASGLENGLMNVLLAAGVVWTLEGGVRNVWGALPLGLLAITRPEGPLYVAVVGVLVATFRLRSHGAAARAWIAAGAVLSILPWASWTAFAWWYFAWPLPNTYYAKLADTNLVRPLDWASQGWKHTRNWALQHTWGFYLPLAGLAHGGLRGPRVVAGITVGLATVALLVPGLGWLPFLPPEPEWLMPRRVLALGFLVLIVPCLGAGRPQDEDRILAWCLACTAVLFPVYGSGGDWMTQWRFMSAAQVPLAVLMVDFVGQVLAIVRERRSRAAARADVMGSGRAQRVLTAALAGPVLVSSVVGTIGFLTDADTAPYGVYNRVAHMHGVRDRLHLDHVKVMEVDMGAQMWWGDYELVDMAGLVDVPIGHHRWQVPFVRDYVFVEQRPDFAHVHGFWMNKAQMQKQNLFRRDYLEVPGYPVVGGSLHIGNYIRRDLFIAQEWWGTDERTASFEEEVELVGLDVPARTVAPGQSLYLELGWTSMRHRPNKLRPLVFLVPTGSTGVGPALVREVPIGYDWVAQRDWRKKEVIGTRVTLSLPDELLPGDYDLGVLLLKSEEEVLPARKPAESPVLGAGEVRFPGVVLVRPLAEVEEKVARDTAALIGDARGGRCSVAERSLARIRRHLRPDHPAQPRDRAEVIEALARCWAGGALTAPTDSAAEAAIASARRWDHWHPLVREAGVTLADRWEEAGHEARAAGKLEPAYQALRRALVADPSRAWTRREAEELRDERLGLD